MKYLKQFKYCASTMDIAMVTYITQAILTFTLPTLVKYETLHQVLE